MNEKQEQKRERLQLWKSGCFLGLGLTVSAMLILSLHNDENISLDFVKWFPLILPGYLLVGVLIVWYYTRPRSGRISHKIHEYFRGISLARVIFLICLAAFIINSFIPTVFRLTFAANAVVLLILWLFDYVSTVRLCNVLNANRWKLKRTLLYDLDECPKSKEAFFTEIEKYCESNHLELKYIEKDNPALVTLNGVYHTVMIEYSYHSFGPLYSLKFVEMDEDLR